jgi:hypothetical protein
MIFFKFLFHFTKIRKDFFVLNHFHDDFNGNLVGGSFVLSMVDVALISGMNEDNN